MSRNNKLSSINSKDSLNVVQLPFPIPSSKIQNSENLTVLNPKSVYRRSLRQSVEGLRSFSEEKGSEGHALKQGLGLTKGQAQGPLAIKRALGILHSGSKTENLSLLKKRKVLKTLPFFNRSFDKKRLKLLFSWYYANKGENAAFSLVETLQKLGFTYAMKAGISLGVDDLKVPSTKIDSLTEAVEALNNTKASVESGNVTALEEFQQFVDTWHRTSENLKTSVIQNFTKGLAKKKSLPNSLKQSKLKKPTITSFPSFYSLEKALAFGPFAPKGQGQKGRGLKGQGPDLPFWDCASSARASKAKLELEPSDYRSLDETSQRQSLIEGGKDPQHGRLTIDPKAQNTKAISQKINGKNPTEGLFRERKTFSLEDSTRVSVQNFSEYKPLLRSYGNNLNPVYMMAFSGARGNLSQVRQLVGMRGLMADPQGQLVEFPIQSNFREGLTVTEYMISCYGARKGLVDTALRTAAAGYLTRRLVDVSHHQIVRSVTCGTKSGVHLPLEVNKALEVNKEGKEKSPKSNRTTKTKEKKSLAFYIGRVLARDIPGVAFRNQEIDTALGSSRHFRDVYENVGIYIRSPLTCKSEIGICQLCYGWSVSANRLVGLGEAVGIIAAQSIGEPGTQLTMRTFHTGGVFSGDIMEECRAKHEGIVCFQGASLGLMVRTAGGAIAFCIKTTGIMQIKGLEKLTTYTLLPNTLLFVRQGEKVWFETLLAQIPNLPEIEESTGESTKTIVSNLSGEVRQTPTVNFELENIRILAGEEYVPFFCSKVLPDNQILSSYMSLAQEPLAAVDKGLAWRGPKPTVASCPKGLPQRANGQTVLYKLQRNAPQEEKKKVNLIQGSHRIGNHTRTYRKNAFLTEKYKFIKYKQKSLPFLENFGSASKDMVQKTKGLTPCPKGPRAQPMALTPSKVIPTLLVSTSKVLPTTNLSYGFDSFWSESFGYGQSINGYFFSKISKLLTKNSFRTGMLLQLRSLKVLKKQKKRLSLKALLPFAKSLDLRNTRKVDQKNLNVFFIIKNLPKPRLNKITFLQNKTINFVAHAPLGHGPSGHATFAPKGQWQKWRGPKGQGFASKGLPQHSKGQAAAIGTVYGAQSFTRQVQKSPQSLAFRDFTEGGLGNSLKIKTFFLYKQFFFHQYNTPLLLYKCKNPKDFVVQQILRKGLVLKKANQKAQAINQKTTLKAINPYVGIILRSFNNTKNNRLKKIKVEPLVAPCPKGLPQRAKEHNLKDFSFLLWWPLNLQESSIKKQKIKFYTFNKFLQTISITKSIKLSKYSFLFWKLSFVIFVRSLHVKKKKLFFFNKRILKNLQWWGSSTLTWTSRATTRQSTFSSFCPKGARAKLYKKSLESSVKRVPLRLAIKAPVRDKTKEGFWTNSLSLGEKGTGLSANSHYYQQASRIDLESHQQNVKRLDSLLTSQKTGEIFPIQGNISLKSFQKSYRFLLKPQKKGNRTKVDSRVRPSDWLFEPNKAQVLDQWTKGYMSWEPSFEEFYRSNPRTMLQQKGQRGWRGTSRESHSAFGPWRLRTATSRKTNNLILTHNDRVSYNLVNKQSVENTNRFKDYKLTLFKKPLKLVPRLYQTQSLLELPSISLSKTQTKYFKPQIGYFINIGDELIKNFGSAHCGQIIEKSYSQLTLRFNQNVLYSNLKNRPAVVSKHVKNGSWLCKGTSLVTLPYISSITGDIVAGIPKIEQLFEARGEALEKTVDKMWSSYKIAVVPRAKAVRECFKEIGLFVVAAIQKVYSSQGVQIADKHLEVIIRQMIGRALIVDPGDTPFLPEEFVDLQTIERVNWTTYGERASYRPHLLGITKASLTSNSFLSSASFQQTARVLERETFLEKTDRLLGLKERVMMGALINAGTGDFQTGVGLSKVSKTFLRKN